MSVTATRLATSRAGLGAGLGADLPWPDVESSRPFQISRAADAGGIPKLRSATAASRCTKRDDTWERP